MMTKHAANRCWNIAINRTSADQDGEGEHQLCQAIETSKATFFEQDEEHQLVQAIEASKATSFDQDEDHQMVQAIEASKATARNEFVYNEALNIALGLSEEDSMKAAMQASLQSEQERSASLALRAKASTTLVQASVNQQGLAMEYLNSNVTLQSCSDHPFTPSVRTLKVVQGSDVRRLRVQWISDASSDEVMSCLKDAVEKGFELGTDIPYVLKYFDNEGDLCTIVDETIFDFLDLTNHASMKLILDIGISASSATSSQLVKQDEIDDTFVEENAISIATPPETPRAHAIEGVYEASWDIIGDASFPSDAGPAARPLISRRSARSAGSAESAGPVRSNTK